MIIYYNNILILKIFDNPKMYTPEIFMKNFTNNINIVKETYNKEVTIEDLTENFMKICTIIFGFVINFIIRQLVKALFLYLTKINFFTILVTLLNTV